MSRIREAQDRRGNITLCSRSGRRQGGFTAEEAEAMAAKGEKVILVRRETSPEDVEAMFVAQELSPLPV